MANRFVREPIEGGDQNSWAAFLLSQTRMSEGVITGQLYNSGGTLKVPACKIGINDGTNRGVAEIDTITDINLAGVSNETWAKIEMTVSGTSVAFAAADIVGATDPTTLPSEFKNSFNAEKGGFYIDSDKRCIGLAWLNGSGVLLAVINVKSHEKEWWASQIGLHTNTIHEQIGPGQGFIINIGDWDMNADETTNFNHGLDVFIDAIKSIDGIIRRDDDVGDQYYYGIPSAIIGSTSQNIAFSTITPTAIFLLRLNGGMFDNNQFDKASFNRGWIVARMRDF